MDELTPLEHVHLTPGSVGYVNAQKTECPNGHPLTPDNLYAVKGGKRKCRTCHREQEQERRRKLREGN